MSVLPAELSTGTVHGRFIVAVIDGDDADQEPEVIPATGRIVFKASVGYIPVPSTNEGPVTVMKGPITGVLDSEGYLSTPHPTTGEPMYRGVKLLATDDPDMAVTDWTWAADYRFESVNGVTLQIPAHSFALPGGTVVDLTTMVKVPSSPGYGLPQAEAAVLRAEAAAQVALDVKAMADAGEFDGAQGLPGNATMRVDTSVGKRVYIGNGSTEELVSADSGWRNIATYIGSQARIEAGTPGGSFLRIRKTNNMVHLAFRIRVQGSHAQGSYVTFVEGLPAALSPYPTYGPIGMSAVIGKGVLEIDNAGTSSALRAGNRNVTLADGDIIAGQISYVAGNDTWLTALPGSPA